MDKFLLHLRKCSLKPHYLCINEVNTHDKNSLFLNEYKLIAFSYIVKINGEELRGGVAIFERANLHASESMEINVQVENIV